MTSRCFIAAFLGCLMLGGCGTPPVENATKSLRSVRVQVVQSTGGQRMRAFSGSARAGFESKLSFRVSGTILELPVRLGDKVDKGDLIARLDSSDYQLQVDDAKASLSQAQAQSKNAAANYARISDLYANNNVSINDLDAARAGRDSARAQVLSITKKLELARAQLGYTELTAPLNGFIAGLNSEANENVQAGQAIAVLNAGSRPETTFVVPEQLVTHVREGEPVTVRFDALPDQIFDATITEVGVASGNLATTYPVTARLNNPNSEVRQGMAAEVSMIFGGNSEKDRSQLLVKPKAVVQDQKNQTFVFIAQPNGDGTATVRRRNVKTGEMNNDGLEITEGLQEGSLLITAGLRFLKEDMQVRMPEVTQE